MKRKLLLLISIFSIFIAEAQEVQKKILVEHFTNTYCSICANKNPVFYSTASSYSNVVHLAFHPSSPYPSCPFSQHNITENDARTNYYGIFGGTPRVVVNGSVIPTGSNLITSSTLDAENDLTSPFEIEVEQFAVGNDSLYSEITLRTVSNTNITSAFVYVAISESTLNFNAQNGENVHHDVFRTFLGGNSGISIGIPANGNDTVFTMGTIIDQDWAASELTTTVILQEPNKNVLQAEQSDKLSTTTSIDVAKAIEKAIYPNPARDFLYVNNEGLLIEKVEIYNILGSLVQQVPMSDKKSTKILVSDFEEGNYIVRIYDAEGDIFTRKVVVDY